MSTTGEAATYQRLRAHLNFLKLPAAAEALPGILDAARGEDLSMVAVLEQLLAVEVDTTQARRSASRLRFACLPTDSSLDEFDFTAQPGVDEKLIRELASLRFLDDAGNIVFVGPPGTGKTMLAIGWPAPPPRPATGSTSPPPTSWPNAAARPPPKAAGPPACGSSAVPDCWLSTNSPTPERIPIPMPTPRCSK